MEKLFLFGIIVKEQVVRGMKSKISKLRAEFKTFQKIPFPFSGLDEDAGCFHAHLVEYDGYIAGYVMTLLLKPKIRPKKVQPDQNIRKRLHYLIKKHGERDDLIEFQKYLDRLEKLLYIANQI